MKPRILGRHISSQETRINILCVILHIHIVHLHHIRNFFGQNIISR